jgi:hypothetical protein
MKNLNKQMWEMTNKEVGAFTETVREVPKLARKNRAYIGKGKLFELDGHNYYEDEGIIIHTINVSAHRSMIDEAMVMGFPVPNEVKEEYIGVIFNDNLEYLWPQLLKTA